MGVLSNRVRRGDIKPGDHIYSWRTAYTYGHHGIYIGDDKVVNFTRGHGEELGTGTVLDHLLTVSRSSRSSATCEKCGHGGTSAGVVCSCLDCFLDGDPLYRFEYEESAAVFLVKVRGGTCTLAKSDPPEEVVRRARYLLENGFGCYHVFRNNCEDFAMYCKTGLLVMDENGIGRSGQAVSFIGAPVAAVFSSPMRFLVNEPWAMMAVSAGVYCFSRYAADLGVRRDVIKVGVEELVTRLNQLPPGR